MTGHIARVLLSLILLVGVPVYLSGYPARLAGGADAMSSATVIIEQPSGAYVVLINKRLHRDEEKLKTWQTFFSGGEIDYIFEDISCLVAGADAAGIEIARSFQSRLPENQMSLRTEDATLLFSKVTYGKFDVVLVSQEIFDAYSAQNTYQTTDESGSPLAVTVGSKTPVAVGFSQKE